MSRNPELEPAVEKTPVIHEGLHQEKNRQLGDPQEFISNLAKNALLSTDADVRSTIREFEFVLKGQDRKVEIYTDPDLQSFCCMEVPTKVRGTKGKMIDDPTKKTYLIGMPEKYVKGKAPKAALRGWLWHELGHAQHSDYDFVSRLGAIAKIANVPPDIVKMIFNCLEDPRMERNVGGPINEPQRLDLFEKNRLFVLPVIGKQLESSKSLVTQKDGSYTFDGGPLSPEAQFAFLIKLERVWALHENDFKNQLPERFVQGVNPEVLKAYNAIRPIIIRITGDANTPALKKQKEFEKLFIEVILPAVKSLLKKPDVKESKNEKSDQSYSEKNDRESEQEEQKSPDAKSDDSAAENAEPSSGTSDPESQSILDPKHPETWPEELQNIAKKILQKHLERTRDEHDTQDSKQASESKVPSVTQSALLQARPKPSPLKVTEGLRAFEALQEESKKTSVRLQSVFERYLPPSEESVMTYGRRGLQFDSQRLVKKFGTGLERPLGRRELITSGKSMVLQIVIDVSGSMYSGNKERIHNALVGAIAVCEAQKRSGVSGIEIEILVSDELNAEKNEAYVIKAFDEPYSEEVKARLGNVVKDFGKKGNEDAESVAVAFQRLQRKMREVRSISEQTVGMMLFVSDSATKSSELKKIVEEKSKIIPIEGIAITPEKSVADNLRAHFGERSSVPASIEDFPDALAAIISTHARKLR